VSSRQTDGSGASRKPPCSCPEPKTTTTLPAGADLPRSALASTVVRPWVGPLALLTAVFLTAELPAYLSLDPGRSRAVAPPDFPPYYPLLVTHIFLGSVALVTACLQVWPWMRQNHPAVHRNAGRVYVCAVLAASPCALVIAPLGALGPNQQVPITMLALMWPAATIIGYRMGRKLRFDEHRKWMIRSFALSFSIVTQRPLGAVCVQVFAPGPTNPASISDQAAIAQAMGVSFWLSWILNLLAAELWIRHRGSELLGPGRNAA